jgi:hypothetical protein
MRVVIDHDPDPDFSYLEQDCFIDERTGKHPDPDDYVALWMRLVGECECCGASVTLDSLGNIDFLADSDEWRTGSFAAPDFRGLDGYLRECALNMLAEHAGGAACAS